MKRLLLAASLMAAPVLADPGDDAVQYCRDRGDIEQCKAEHARGLAKYREGEAWLADQDTLAGFNRAGESIVYCVETYKPIWLAVGACIDGAHRIAD